jgi:membrane fusion protein, multidrug efflux system
LSSPVGRVQPQQLAPRKVYKRALLFLAEIVLPDVSEDLSRPVSPSPARKPASLPRRLVITGIVIAVLLGGLAYFQFVFKPQMIRSAISSMRPPPVTVTAEPAKVEKWIERLPSIGTLIANQGVDVASQVAGVITSIALESGEDVEHNGKLVQLDVAVEVADLASAKATLAEAEVAYQRQLDLMQKRVTSEASLDTARTRRDTALAAVRRIEALIAQKSIRAPFAGRLGIRKVEVGQYVSPGMALVSLQELDPIRVDFPMPEQTVGKLKVGQAIELTVGAFPAEVFKGKIQSLDARVAQDTRTLLVRGSLPNKELKMLPGMFANVTVLAGEETALVTVPRIAVTFSLYGDSIYVVKDAPAPAGDAKAGQVKGASPAADGEKPLVAERRFVKTGEIREDRVAVLSGLKADEVVITTGQLKINPGASIRVDNAQELQAPKERPRQ